MNIVMNNDTFKNELIKKFNEYGLVCKFGKKMVS